MTNSYTARAELFLTLEGLLLPSGKKLLNYQNFNWFLYTGKKSIRIEEKMLENMIILFSKRNPSFLENTGTHVLKDLIRNIQALVTTDDIKEGEFIGQTKPSNVHYIPMNNGILKLMIQDQVITKTLLEHDSDFFSTYFLPYDYNPEAPCPVFMKFIKEVLEPGEILLLQQFIAYCFLPLTILEYIIFLLGTGANGKSVFCTIIRLVLGKENISSFALKDLFKRFSMVEIIDKIANIVEEIDDQNFHNVGKLKDFVSGGLFMAEPKYKPSFQFQPRTKLIYATNVIPKLKDNSNGMKRRMLIIEFKKQFLDPSKQDKRLKSEDFWLESGELSGIFNWLLVGLEELIRNNWQLPIPDSVKDAIKSYDQEINPSKHYFDEYLEADSRAQVFSLDVYKEYEEFCKLHNYTEEKYDRFTRALKIHFPTVIHSNSAKRRKYKPRSKIFYGIRFRKADLDFNLAMTDTPDLDFSKVATDPLTNSKSSPLSQMALLASLTSNYSISNLNSLTNPQTKSITVREVLDEK